MKFKIIIQNSTNKNTSSSYYCVHTIVFTSMCKKYNISYIAIFEKVIQYYVTRLICSLIIANLNLKTLLINYIFIKLILYKK